MAVIKGIIREVGKSSAMRISARRWHASTQIVVQDPETKKTYSVRISSNTMDRCRFLPRVGIPVVIEGYVEEAEYGLSDYVVSRVTYIKREGAGIKGVHKFDD
ncbi:MAG: hypothetical protein BAJATHORv1_30206 [Candidatus Thorarchaeota archaeon]|nr:MAG: hypothetical protein BAJATHORv1_30206 [Candidatus Thorarchaeota archaeon]